MSPEHYSEVLLIETSRLQRAALALATKGRYLIGEARHRRFLIVFMLDDRKPIRAKDLASHFGVSIRAIYRDMAALSAVHEAFTGIGGGYLRRRR